MGRDSKHPDVRVKEKIYWGREGGVEVVEVVVVVVEAGGGGGTWCDLGVSNKNPSRVRVHFRFRFN